MSTLRIGPDASGPQRHQDSRVHKGVIVSWISFV